MPQISFNVTLGRIAMAHTAKPGLHLQQDAVTGLWHVASLAPKVTRLQRLWLSTQTMRSNRWIVATAAGVLGVSLSLLASNFTVFGISSINPVVSFKAPSQVTTSIALATVDYGQPSAPESVALPPPFPNPVPLPQLPFLADPAASVTNDPQPAGNRTSASRQSMQPRATPPDAPLAVFNEPLQPKTGGTSPVTLAAQPLATQQPQSRSVPAILSASSVVSSKPAPNSKSAGSTPTAPPDSVAPQSPGAPSDSRGYILAMPNSESIVVTNPSSRLPIMVKLGERLPDGSTLKSVDKNSSSALTSRGETLSLR